MNQTPVILAIDLGKNGGMAVEIAEKTCVWKMPETPEKTVALFRRLKNQIPDLSAVIEKVNFHHEGDAATRSATAAMNAGFVYGVLMALGIPIIDEPSPQEWMKVVVPDRPKALTKAEREGKSKDLIKQLNAKRKQERKNYIKDKVEKEFPNVQTVTTDGTVREQKVTLWNSDALGLLLYAQKRGL